jgi:hypothetical protein
MRESCPDCHLRLARHEDGYYTGAASLTLSLCVIVLAAVVAVVLIVTWPRVPWSALEYAGIPMTTLVAVLVFPFSKLLWLAFDLRFRPPTIEDLRPQRPSTPPEVRLPSANTPEPSHRR